MITSKIIASGILRVLGFIAAIALLGYVLFKLQTVILYLVLSVILTLIGNRIKYFMIKYFRFSNLFASIATILFFIIIFLGFALMFVPLILSQIESLALLNIADIEKNVVSIYSQLSNFLNIHGLDADKILSQSNWHEKIDFQTIPNFLNILISAITDFGIGMVSVLFITFFFLKDRDLMISGIKNILPENHKEKILSSLRKTKNLLTKYLIGIVIQLSVVFVLYLIVLLVFGVNNALTIAFLCALLNIVPYIGPLVGTIFAAILTMTGQFGNDFQTQIIPTTVYVFIGFIIIHLIDSNISQPLIFSNSTKSHPLEIFLVILIAAFLFGVLGMIVAIPTYTVLKVIGKEFFPENKIIQLLTQKL